MSRHWAATVVMLGQLGAAGVERQRRGVSSSEVKTLARHISKIAVLRAVQNRSAEHRDDEKLCDHWDATDAGIVHHCS